MKGLQSHASEPEKGNNPAYLMAALTQLIEPLKEFNGFTPRTWNGIEFKNLVMATLVYQRLGEKAFGVSPSTAEMGLTLRAYYEAEIDQLIVAIEEFVKTEAEKKGLTVDFEQLERFPETASDEALVEKIQPLMDQWGFRWALQEEAMRGSEDFGHIAKLVPSIYFLLGLGEDSPPMHNVAFEFKDEVIPIGLDLFEKIARYGV